MASRIISCRNVGCRTSFKSYQERLRHETKCSKTKPAKPNNILDFLDIGGKYLCRKCNIVIVQRNNLKRHRLSCKGQKYMHTCRSCSKIFQFKCKLERHEKQVHQEKKNVEMHPEIFDEIPDEMSDE